MLEIEIPPTRLRPVGFAHGLRKPRAAASRPGSRWIAGATSLAAAVIVHALFLTALIGAGKSTKTLRVPGLGANEIVSGEEEATATMFFFEDSQVTDEADEQRESFVSHGKILQALRLTIVAPEPDLGDIAVEVDPSAANVESEPDAASSDRQGTVALYGRYLGQIQARVERAWMRPRSVAGADGFECRVQIQQNERGEVGEVTLQKCDTAVAWQLSLVRAIERASPLPAPPDPKVFTKSFELSFHADPYVAGTSEEGYEPPQWMSDR